MSSYTDYQRQLESVLKTKFTMKVDRSGVSIDGTIHFPDDPETVVEARQQLADLRQQQKELRLLKKEMALAIKEIRSGYTAQESGVQAGFLASIGGKKAAGQDRAYKREQLRQKEQEELRPYNALSQLIDQAILRLDSRKLGVDRIATKLKAG